MVSKFELTTASITTLENPKLRSNLTEMLKAVAEQKKSVWDYASAISNIVNGKMYMDDFSDQKTFAKAINVSEATISQYCKAVKYVKRHKMAKPYLITVGKAYMLSLLTTAQDKELLEFIDKNGIDISLLSDKALKDTITTMFPPYKKNKPKTEPVPDVETFANELMQEKEPDSKEPDSKEQDSNEPDSNEPDSKEQDSNESDSKEEAKDNEEAKDKEAAKESKSLSIFEDMRAQVMIITKGSRTYRIPFSELPTYAVSE